MCIGWCDGASSSGHPGAQLEGCCRTSQCSVSEQVEQRWLPHWSQSFYTRCNFQRTKLFSTPSMSDALNSAGHVMAVTNTHCNGVVWQVQRVIKRWSSCLISNSVQAHVSGAYLNQQPKCWNNLVISAAMQCCFVIYRECVKISQCFPISWGFQTT